MVAESVAAKIFKIGLVVFELWPFYLITLWSAFVSITKNEHDGGKHTLISFFKALWWPGFICKFLASQTYDFNQIFSVGRENIVRQAHIIS